MPARQPPLPAATSLLEVAVSTSASELMLPPVGTVGVGRAVAVAVPCCEKTLSAEQK
jgi:hypothetical protein